MSLNSFIYNACWVESDFFLNMHEMILLLVKYSLLQHSKRVLCWVGWGRSCNEEQFQTCSCTIIRLMAETSSSLLKLLPHTIYLHLLYINGKMKDVLSL